MPDSNFDTEKVYALANDLIKNAEKIRDAFDEKCDEIEELESRLETYEDSHNEMWVKLSREEMIRIINYILNDGSPTLVSDSLYAKMIGIE